MINKPCKVLCLLLLLFGLSPLSLAANEPLKILFIGNSLTYGNSLPTMLESMANNSSSHQKLQVEMVTIGGSTLSKHWYDGRALAAIQKGGWDYVVLQEHSKLGSKREKGKVLISHPKTFHTYVSLFNKEIRAVKANTLLYLTWANEDRATDQPTLNKAYSDIARELNATLIPVGPVWQQVRHQLPSLSLYLEDKLHPTAAGSYVAAAVFYAHLFKGIDGNQVASISAQRYDETGKVRSEKKELLVELKQEQAQAIHQLAQTSVEPSFEFIQKTTTK